MLDDVHNIVLGSGAEACTYPNAPDNSVVSCPLSGALNVIADDLDDRITVANDVPMTFLLRGEEGADTMDGGGLDDRIDGETGNDILRGDGGDDRIFPDIGTDTVDGGPGSDWVDYDDDNHLAGVTVNLSTGEAPEGDQLTSIENIDGTFFNDQLTGDASDNRIRGSDGVDRLDGGAGVDTLSYAGRFPGIVLNLTTGSNSDNDLLVGQWEAVLGSSEDDQISAASAPWAVRLMGSLGADTLVGGDLADVLEGGDGNDSLGGGGGDDLLLGGVGADALAGGAGVDTASYRERTDPVIASLIDGQARPDGDSYVEIEGLEGGSANDALRGTDAANQLIGNAGADLLVGGGGADLLYGNTTAGASDGASDTVSYDDGRTTAVVTALAGHHQDDDFYSDIQNLIGGSGNDALAGDAGANLLIGGAGNDILVGDGGKDDLQGSEGNDELEARDGEVDNVNCGPGTDFHVEDAIDILVECEAPPLILDRTAPNTRITRHPRRLTKSRRAAFRVASTERGSTFQCKLDRRPWRRCNINTTYRKLKRGRHTFLARARDRAGNVDRTPASFRWRVRR